MSATPQFCAVLQPHRSLSQRGFWLFIGLAAAFSLIPAAVFTAMGAWPVSGFLGLDVLLLYIAFRLNFRALNRREVIELFERELRITKVPSLGRPRSVSFNPYWVRLHFHTGPDGRGELWVSCHGRRLVLGSFLSPEEKSSLAERLRQVLAHTRAYPTEHWATKPG